jgi:hypothetical protein
MDRTASLRKARQRRRERENKIVLPPTEIPMALVDELIDGGWLPIEDSENGACVAEALVRCVTINLSRCPCRAAS